MYILRNLLEANVTLLRSCWTRTTLLKLNIDFFCLSPVVKTQHLDNQVALPQIQVQVPQVAVSLKVEEEGLQVEIEV